MEERRAKKEGRGKNQRVVGKIVGEHYIESSKRSATEEFQFSSVLCDLLEGWDREVERETQVGGDMGIYVHIYLIHFSVQQKLTQHWKPTILQ